MMATQITRSKFSRGEQLTSPNMVRLCLGHYLSDREREVFLVIFLDNQQRVIESEEMFSGTIDAAYVYPREVVKAALKYNAKSIILCHNHPSGSPEPSQADRRVTRMLSDALAIVEVNIQDHFVVGAEGVTSFAERGWI
ncbi:DNA repair protein RadC [Vibrio sp. 10N.222.54.A1]